MKISIQEDPSIGEVEIVVHCPKADTEVYRLLALLHAAGKKLAGVKEGQTFLVEPKDVLYFESVDKRTYLYTADAVLEIPLRLYELEAQLSEAGFFRASKNSVVNAGRIASLRPALGNRMELVLENGERRYVSRQYVPNLKNTLNI